MFGFRGEHSTGTPMEIFPDMVRQQKVRAQAPLDFFADGRGPRVPIARHGPDWLRNAKAADDERRLGYRRAALAAGEECSRTRIGFSVGTDYYNTGKMGTNWGTGIADRR